MQGSWSIKAVLPTVAPDLSYANARRGAGRARGAARLLRGDRRRRRAAPRRAALRRALLDYCRQDTLALARLVEFFAPGLD